MPISSYVRLRIFLLMAIVSAFVVSMAFTFRGTTQASGPVVTTFKGYHLTATRAAQAQVSLQAKAQAQTNNQLRVRVTPLLKKGSANAVHASAVNSAAPHTANLGTSI